MRRREREAILVRIERASGTLQYLQAARQRLLSSEPTELRARLLVLNAKSIGALESTLALLMERERSLGAREKETTPSSEVL